MTAEGTWESDAKGTAWCCRFSVLIW
jgi:hypothetical protein